MNRKDSASHVRDVGASGRNRFRRHGPSAVMVMNTLRKLLKFLVALLKYNSQTTIS